jgi:hypothetical protein
MKQRPALLEYDGLLFRGRRLVLATAPNTAFDDMLRHMELASELTDGHARTMPLKDPPHLLIGKGARPSGDMRELLAFRARASVFSPHLQTPYDSTFADAFFSCELLLSG